MTILGAQLDDLADLAHRLQATAGDVGLARESARQLTTDVVTDVNAAVARALERITSAMHELDGSVADAGRQAERTQWTGGNADRFRHAAQEFHVAIVRSEDATNQSFDSFRASVETMTQSIDEYVTRLSTSLTEAESAAQQMSSAVTAQRDNLDQVMNSGLSVG